MKRIQKTHRTFSAAFKQEKVELPDRRKITVKELSKVYEVSETAINKWKKNYSKLEKSERFVLRKSVRQRRT